MDVVIIRRRVESHDAMREMDLVRGRADWTWWSHPRPARSVILLGLPDTLPAPIDNLGRLRLTRLSRSGSRSTHGGGRYPLARLGRREGGEAQPPGGDPRSVESTKSRSLIGNS